MADFLVWMAQAACILGLLYGAYLCIMYTADSEPAPTQERFDPVTTHTWAAPSSERLRHHLAPVSDNESVEGAHTAPGRQHDQRIHVELRQRAFELRGEL